MEAAFATYTVPSLLEAMMAFFALAAAWLKRQLPHDIESLADRIEQVLPLTQCAQCGHPGCRHYVVALAAGEAIDRCSPAGAELVIELKNLMGTNTPLSQEDLQVCPAPLLAVIDESACIGCTLCLDRCPLAAIVGSRGFVHTAIEAECKGCGLCTAPCPVDGISLMPKVVEPAVKRFVPLGRGCINCGRCIDVCPVTLQPDQPLKLRNAEDWAGADDLELQGRVGCGLCDRICPSEISLSLRFTEAKRIASEPPATEAEKHRIKRCYQKHQQRLIAVQSEAEDQRAQRLARRLVQRSAEASVHNSKSDS